MDRQQLIDAAGVEELAGHMAIVESLLKDYIPASGQFGPLINKHMEKGKRLRPILLILSVMLNNQSPSPETLASAAAIEMLHQASMLHDKVIDAETDEDAAMMILAGDYLIACSFKASPENSVLFAECIAVMSKGQLLQQDRGHRPDPANKKYIEVISQKTVPLFAAACHLGCRAAGLKTKEAGQVVNNYAVGFGTSFQIIDDLMDGEFAKPETPNAIKSARKYSNQAIECLSALPDSEARLGLANITSAYLKSCLSDVP